MWRRKRSSSRGLSETPLSQSWGTGGRKNQYPHTQLQQPGSERRVHGVTGGRLPQGLLGLNNILCLCVRPPRCKFFSLTETPEDYTIIVDEEGFLGMCFSPRGLGWPWSVVSAGCSPACFCLHLLVGCKVGRASLSPHVF